MQVDWCTRRDTESALRMLTGMYPGERITADEDLVRTWYSELARFPGAVVLDAASTFDGERFPNRLQFVRHCEAVARDRVRATMVDQRAEQQELEVAPPLDPEVASLFVHVMREAMTTAVEPASHRDHTLQSAAACPVCSTAQLRGEMIAAEATRMLLELGIVVSTASTTYACPECRDAGAVIVDESSMTVRPCSRCTPSGFLLHRHGHYKPGHACKRCRTPKAKREFLASLTTGGEQSTVQEPHPGDEMVP